MKRLILLSALFSFLLVGCGGSEPSVEGKWQLESVSGEELSESEKNMTLEFQEGGSMVSERGGEQREGTWELSEDGKTLTFTHDDRDTENEVVELTEEKLVLKEGGDKITLKRL